MNSSCKCGKSFIHKYDNTSSIQINDSKYYNVSSNFLDEADFNNEVNNSYLECFGYLFEEKDDNLKLIQIHEEIFDICIDKMNHVSDKTMKYYLKILSKFTLFSPAVDPDELEKFIK